MNQEAFVEDSRTYDATLRNLRTRRRNRDPYPGRRAGRAPRNTWGAAIGTRNHIAHAYLGIDDDTVWSIIQDAIPTILPQLRRLLATNE